MPRWKSQIKKELRKIEQFNREGKHYIIISEVNGMGDYLWTQSYFRLLKNSKEYGQHILVLLGRRRFEEMARKLSKNDVDIFLFFDNPSKPMDFELEPLKHIFADAFVNFRSTSPQYKKLVDAVHATRCFGNEITYGKRLFYRENRNIIFSQFYQVPDSFQHELDVVPYSSEDYLHDKYAVLVLSGYTAGSFTREQCRTIIEHIINRSGYRILILGEKKDRRLYDEIVACLSQEKQAMLINGCGAYHSWELPYIVSRAQMTVTPNTSIYHMALLTDSPVVVVTINELSSIDLGKPGTRVIMNAKLKKSYFEGTYLQYSDDTDAKIEKIDVGEIVDQIDSLYEELSENHGNEKNL